MTTQNEPPPTSSPHPCRYCGNKGLFRVLNDHSEEEELPIGGSAWETWQLAQCPVCEQISLLHSRGTYQDVEQLIDDGVDPESYLTKVVFPPAKHHPKGLPRHISEALMGAEKLRPFDTNAYGVQLRRVVELVCLDRRAKNSANFLI